MYSKFALQKDGIKCDTFNERRICLLFVVNDVVFFVNLRTLRSTIPLQPCFCTGYLLMLMQKAEVDTKEAF